MTTLLAQAYLHRFDPFAIEFPAGWFLPGLRWYGLAYLAGFLVAWLLIRWLARSGRSPIPAAAVGDLMLYGLVGVVAGGRLGYCVFYDQSLLVEFTGRFPFWGVLAIHTGGMSSHGGMLGVIVAGWLFARKYGISKLHLVEVGALVSPPGLCFGRLANFVNAELVGRPLPGSMQAAPPWWSIKYAKDIHGWSPAQQGELGDAVDAAGLSSADWLGALRRVGLDRQADTFVTSTMDGLVAEVQAGNEAVIKAMRPLLEAYYPSQLFQALTDGPILLAVLALVWWRPRKPGVIGSWFLMSYGVLRILTESLRQPDEGVAVLATPFGDLSRGQVLSVLMIVCGLVALVICVRRPVEPIGGLSRAHRRVEDPPGRDAEK